MIVVIRFPKDTKPVVVTTFEGHDEQTQAVIRDPFDGCLSAGNNPEVSEAFGME